MRSRVESLLMWRSDEKGEEPLAGLRWRLKGLAVRAHPHLRMRYQPVVRHLREVADDGTRVLEVGAGSLGITRYWRRPVTGVDIDFKGPRLGYLDPVQASAEALPFGDGSFDIVISVDMLEHLTSEQRHNAVREMLRVASREVLIGIPCGHDARVCEHWARSLCEQTADAHYDAALADRIRARSAFLDEHDTCGLPVEEDVIALIDGWCRESGHSVRVESFGNEPIWYWRLMLPAVVPLSGVSAALSRVAGFVLQPLLPMLPDGPTYRTFFLARKKPADFPGS